MYPSQRSFWLKPCVSLYDAEQTVPLNIFGDTWVERYMAVIPKTGVYVMEFIQTLVLKDCLNVALQHKDRQL